MCAGAGALAAAALRRWQLASAFEPPLGLSVPGAQASVILVCVRRGQGQHPIVAGQLNVNPLGQPRPGRLVVRQPGEPAQDQSEAPPKNPWGGKHTGGDHP